MSDAPATVLTAADYRSALDVQSACNLQAVVASLARLMPRIAGEVRRVGGGTDQLNGHPIVRLYVEQLVHLSSRTSYYDAHVVCTSGAAGLVDVVADDANHRPPSSFRLPPSSQVVVADDANNPDPSLFLD